MKDSILKKIISLLLSVTLAVGMNGVSVWAEDSASPENGIAGHAAENAVFTVKVGDGPIEYKQKEDFAQVWKDIQGETAEICLLESLDVSDIDFHIDGIDGDDGNTSDTLHSLLLTAGKITLTMEAGISLNDGSNGDNQLIVVKKDGTFILKRGEISSVGTALTVDGGNVHIINGTLEGNGTGSALMLLGSKGKPNVQIEECTLKSGQEAVVETMGEVNDILANGYAFQNESHEWVKPNDQSSLKKKGIFYITKFPVDFIQQPAKTRTAIYGSSPESLQAEAGITDSSKLSNSDIEANDTPTYQWQQMKDGKWENAIGRDANTSNFTPSEILPVGSYQYRCVATYKWFSLYSNEAVITVRPKTVKASIEDEIRKDYDGNEDVTQDSLKLLSITLEGVVLPDSVSGSAVRGKYESKKPGKCEVTVEIELVGDKEGWYKNYSVVHNSSDSSKKAYLTCLADGEIIGVLLNDHTLEMSAGTAQKLRYDIGLGDSSNSKVSWISSNPDVATVDENGNVKAISAGQAVITVIAAEDGKYKDSCTVTVSSAGSGSNLGNIGSSSGGSPSTNVRLPFLKDRPYKRGWGVIQAEAEKAAAEPGSGPAYISIDMNGTVLVPGRIFTAVRNKDVTLAFEMGGGISWSVCGKDITEETVSDTNLSVKAGGGGNSTGCFKPHSRRLCTSGTEPCP